MTAGRATSGCPRSSLSAVTRAERCEHCAGDGCVIADEATGHWADCPVCLGRTVVLSVETARALRACWAAFEARLTTPLGDGWERYTQFVAAVTWPGPRDALEPDAAPAAPVSPTAARYAARQAHRLARQRAAGREP